MSVGKFNKHVNKLRNNTSECPAYLQWQMADLIQLIRDHNYNINTYYWIVRKDIIMIAKFSIDGIDIHWQEGA